MEGKVTVQNITPVRKGVWLIVYKHECDCGCISTRHNFTVNQEEKPSEINTKQLSDADYNKR